MRRKEETFSSRRATTPLAAIMKSSIKSVARFFVSFRDAGNLLVESSGTTSLVSSSSAPLLVAQLLERLRDLVLQFELGLQLRRRRHFRRSRRRAFEPRSHRVVGELCLVANDGAIDIAGTQRAAGIDHEFGDHGGPVHIRQQRRCAGRELIRQHGENGYAGINGGRLPFRMLIDGRIFGDKSVHVGDADHHFDVAIGQALGDFDLVEIFRGVVVDRRPQQTAQVANLVGRRQLRRMRPDVRQLLLRFGRKIRLETGACMTCRAIA